MIKVLITGATGYIGGSIYSRLAQDAHPSVRLGVLLRNQKALDMFPAAGTHLFAGFQDLETIERVAAQYDAVINAASSVEPEPAKAILRGLHQRRKQTGFSAFLVQISGTDILSDDADGRHVSERVYSDLNDDLYAVESSLPPYAARLNDIAVVDTAESLGVPTYQVVAPNIYGKGTGPVATISSQVPYLIRLALHQGQSIMVNQGISIWNHVHIEDLANFFSFLLARVLAGDPSLGTGRKGYYFVQNGEHTWANVSEGIASSLHKLGRVASTEVRQESSEWVAKQLGIGVEVVRFIFSSNARSCDDRARSLGWSPQISSDDFFTHFDNEVAAVLTEAEFQA